MNWTVSSEVYFSKNSHSKLRNKIMPHYLTEEGFELLKNAHIEQAKSLNLKPYKNKWGYITYEGDGLDLVISENNIIVRDQNNKIDYGR